MRELYLLINHKKTLRTKDNKVEKTVFFQQMYHNILYNINI